MGHLVQMVGLTVQNFLSAAVGISVAIALLRGFTCSRTEGARQLLGGPHAGNGSRAAADRNRRRSRAQRNWNGAEVQGRILGFLGEEGVNVLELNLDLDELTTG